jgi:hypothetical protein
VSLIAFPSVSVRFHRARLIGLGSWFPYAQCAAILSSARAQRDSPTLRSFPGEEQRPTACACHSSSWFFDFVSLDLCVDCCGTRPGIALESPDKNTQDFVV